MGGCCIRQKDTPIVISANHKKSEEKKTNNEPKVTNKLK